MTFYLIDIRESLQAEAPVMLDTLVEPHSAGMVRQAFPLGNQLIGTSMSDKGQFFWYNQSQKQVTHWLPYAPVMEEPIPPKHRHNLYSSISRVNPRQQNIVAASAQFDYLQVVDFRGQRKYALQFSPKMAMPDIDFSQGFMPGEEMMTYFYDLETHGEHTLALYAPARASQPLTDIQPKLLVFNKSFELIHTYQLDSGILRFAQQNGQLVAMQLTNQGIQFLHYQLPNL